MLSLLWVFKLLQERSTEAELLLSQVQTPGARCACIQQVAILQQNQQSQKLQRHPAEGGKPSDTPKNRKFRKFPKLLKDLTKP